MVAAHLHMTAGAVRKTMGAHELMCWAYLFGEPERAKRRADEPQVLSVEAEIDAWG